MFYKLKVKADAKRVPSEVLGFPVNQQVSTYVETTRDLVAEAAKKNIKTVDIVAVETLPERGYGWNFGGGSYYVCMPLEDGNNPRVYKLGDHQASEQSEPTDEVEK